MSRIQADLHSPSEQTRRRFLQCTLGAALIPLAASSARSGNSPNFVFFLADDQSKHDHAAYGNPKVPTPVSGSLAEESLVFDRAFTAQAICAPSRSTLYTGLYPLRHGCFLNHYRIRPTVSTVTHYLGGLGYDVILAGKSHVSPDRQFQWTHRFRPVRREGLPRPLIPIEEIDAFFAAAHTRPFCMLVTSEYPHSPYLDGSRFPADKQWKPPFARPSDTKRIGGYYANIEKKEEELEAVLASLDRNGLRDDTVFFYSDDHGAQRGKFTAYDTGLNVAFMVRWPGKFRTGRTSALTSFTDVLPTMIELAGGMPPEDLDGRSLVPVLGGRTDRHHDYVFGVTTNQGIQRRHVFPQRSVHDGRYHYIHNFNSLERIERATQRGVDVDPFLLRGAERHASQPEEELYDTERDPFEMTNLAGEEDVQDIRERLRSVLREWMESQGDFLSFGDPVPFLQTDRFPLDESDRFQELPPELEGSIKTKIVPHQAGSWR